MYSNQTGIQMFLTLNCCVQNDSDTSILAKRFYIFFFRLLTMFYFSSFICPAAGRSPTVSPYCICICQWRNSNALHTSTMFARLQLINQVT